MLWRQRKRKLFAQIWQQPPPTHQSSGLGDQSLKRRLLIQYLCPLLPAPWIKWGRGRVCLWGWCSRPQRLRIQLGPATSGRASASTGRPWVLPGKPSLPSSHPIPQHGDVSLGLMLTMLACPSSQRTGN